MEGTYKLFRQVHGKTKFAQVRVEVLCDATVSLRVEKAAALVAASVPWLDVAVDASLLCLNALESKGVARRDHLVIIGELITNVVDTTDDAVRAAAVLALADAFRIRDQFQLRYDVALRVDWTTEGMQIV